MCARERIFLRKHLSVYIRLNETTLKPYINWNLFHDQECSCNRYDIQNTLKRSTRIKVTPSKCCLCELKTPV